MRFWHHVVTALERVRPGLAERVIPLLGPPPPSSFEVVMGVLINVLAHPGEDGVLLVLDDYERIDSQLVQASRR